MSWEKVIFKRLFLEQTRNGVYKAKEFHGHGTKIINMGELFANDFLGNQDMQRVELNSDERQKDVLQEGDLLFARRSLVESGAGKVSIVVQHNEDLTFESSVIRVRLNPDICYPLFYLYWFRSHAGKQEINGIVTGVNVKGIRGSDLSNIQVDLPSYVVQKKIASILEQYDQAIENNRKQIALLEEAAQRLYREWFVDLHFPGYENTLIVDGVPEGWSCQKLVEIADVQYGFAFDGTLFNSDGKGAPIIRIRNIPEGDTQDFTTEQADEKYLIKDGDILVGMDGEFYINSWVGEPAYLVQRTCCIRPKTEDMRGWLMLAIHDPIKFFEKTVTGATVSHLFYRDSLRS